MLKCENCGYELIWTHYQMLDENKAPTMWVWKCRYCRLVVGKDKILHPCNNPDSRLYRGRKE